MITRLRAASMVSSAVLLALLAGCGDGGDGDSDSEATSSGLPSCSEWANGAKITESLGLKGCDDPGATAVASSACGGGHEQIAVGPVYGFVGKQAHYLGKGEDATKSPEWEKFKQDCPFDSE